MVRPAWGQYIACQSDAETFAKINTLIEETRRDPLGRGTGRAERLQGPLAGWSSKRINKADRLVYRVRGKDQDQTLEIAQCRGHY